MKGFLEGILTLNMRGPKESAHWIDLPTFLGIWEIGGEEGCLNDCNILPHTIPTLFFPTGYRDPRTRATSAGSRSRDEP